MRRVSECLAHPVRGREGRAAAYSNGDLFMAARPPVRLGRNLNVERGLPLMMSSKILDFLPRPPLSAELFIL